jgi:hypothetical protein
MKTRQIDLLRQLELAKQRETLTIMKLAAYLKAGQLEHGRLLQLNREVAAAGARAAELLRAYRAHFFAP